MRPILILGGSGGTGSIIARLLLQETAASVTVAGRDAARATRVADQLLASYPGRCGVLTVDVSNRQQLVAACGEADLVIDATTSHDIAPLFDALVETGVDCIDLHAHPGVLHRHTELAERLMNAGRCVITQVGFHPGLPAVVVRDAATRFRHMRGARVAMAMGLRDITHEAMLELLDIISIWPSDRYVAGTWRTATWRDVQKVDFGERFGRRSCYPISLEEMHPLPRMLGLQELAVQVAGFGWFVDGVVMPLALARERFGTRRGRRAIAHLGAWGLRTLSGKATGVTFICDAVGEGKDDVERTERIVLEHDDPYAFTAIPTVACALQLLDGSIRRPGIQLMGLAVEPTRLLADILRMGVSRRVI